MSSVRVEGEGDDGVGGVEPVGDGGATRILVLVDSMTALDMPWARATSMPSRWRTMLRWSPAKGEMRQHLAREIQRLGGKAPASEDDRSRGVGDKHRTQRLGRSAVDAFDESVDARDVEPGRAEVGRSRRAGVGRGQGHQIACLCDLLRGGGIRDGSSGSNLLAPEAYWGRTTTVASSVRRSMRTRLS